ncbi:hypothetical protein B296_00049306 [Ensete ventricosum]|uniref:Uncharacterized protein n=1 Tax=Ensete ventricosum TaxID=4639 RepID=A0A426YF05_ENSVE|nr:hypothetical protein B296_00049306 [Ensete ventricosum]
MDRYAQHGIVESTAPAVRSAVQDMGHIADPEDDPIKALDLSTASRSSNLPAPGTSKVLFSGEAQQLLTLLSLMVIKPNPCSQSDPAISGSS